MGEQLASRSFSGARLFSACATILLPIVTISPRDAQDRYQSPHLFFLPSRGWEMHQGRAGDIRSPPSRDYNFI